MDLDDYQRQALRHDRVPARAEGGDMAALIVPMLGLAGETGALLKQFKKHLTLLAGIGIALAILVTRSTITPLRQLTEAARQFSVSTEPTSVPERGPRELRTALTTFNLMQRRVREGMRERTHILAAVSHDLQTPLTRMRLRVEKVGDQILRDQLLGDLAAMQRLVTEGLDLAQSTESQEPWSVVDLDSLLSSLAEDMTDLGASVTFLPGRRDRVRVRLTALSRCLQNLVDNAVEHAGGAEIASERTADAIVVAVRDRGPGIANCDLEAAFEAFSRLPSGRTDGRRGTGIGLTIARAQAATFGASVHLANRDGGGLEATIAIPAGRDT